MTTFTKWDGATDSPLRARKPRRYLMPDLFASDDDAAIDRALAIMALCPASGFFLLTEHAGRMVEYFAHRARRGALCNVVRWEMDRAADVIDGIIFPLPNLTPGVHITTQAEANDRLPKLIACPAARRWVHVVPLEAVDLTQWMPIMQSPGGCSLCGFMDSQVGHATHCSMPHVSIISAAPVHPGWVRSLRDQCTAAGVAFCRAELR